MPLSNDPDVMGARLIVRETLISLGFDVSNPTAAQADMLALREIRAMLADENFRDDLAHLRHWRLAMEKISSTTVTGAITLVVGGLLAVMWVGFKDYLLR